MLIDFLNIRCLITLNTCSNEANMLFEHHPTLSDATGWPRLNTMLDNVGRCWIMLEDVGLSLNLLKIFVQHRVTLLAQQCRTMLVSFEQALRLGVSIH